MERLDLITSEGGPLVLLDAAFAAEWRGIEDGGQDYAGACALLEGPEPIDGGTVRTRSGRGIIVWELGGAGAADAFRGDDGAIVIIRTWTGSETAMGSPLLTAVSKHAVTLGTVALDSGFLLVLWAAEDGKCVGSEFATGRPHGDLSVDTAGLIIRCAPGLYVATHDSLVIGGVEGRRCRLQRLE